MATQFGGSVGSFPDRVQQRDVPVDVFGTIEYSTNGPPADTAQLDNEVRMRLLQAIKQVIGPRMFGGELQFRNLGEGTITHLYPEIIAATGLQQLGVQVHNLTMSFGIDGHRPSPPKEQQQRQQPTHEVDAHIHVGGFNIHANSQGGLDTAGLQTQLKDKAKSQILWYGIGCGILLIVGLGLAGLGLYIWKSWDAPGSARAGAAAKWDGKSPFTCGGNDDLKISGVSGKVAATAITASGNCHLTLVNVDVSGATGIEAGGNAVITVQNGSVNGTTFAIHATGNAQVNVTGAKVTGKTLAAPPNAKITGV